MRIGTDRPFHLTYCSNIHPGESWGAVRAQLERHLPPLKARLAPDRPFGVGLRLSDRAARELLEGGRLARFRDWLDARGCYVFTINGFPYGGFHRQVVKEQVYAPDWRRPERVAYSRRLVRILAALVPEGQEGSISTSPLSYKPWLAGDPAARAAAFRMSSQHLAEVVAAMVCMHEATGAQLNLALEPEPDCLIENTAETIDFFQQRLWPVGGSHLARRLGCSRAEAEAHLRRHVTVCYDTCHFALEYEEPSEALARFAEAGIRVGKVQISAAIKADLPAAPVARAALAERLRPFAESTYLHQVIERRTDGTLHRYRDLPDALPHIGRAEAEAWRVHYHVPVFADAFEGLRSTQDDIAKTLRALPEASDCRHLEIETYTWDVLPEALKTDLGASIEREYSWVMRHLRAARPQRQRAARPLVPAT